MNLKPLGLNIDSVDDTNMELVFQTIIKLYTQEEAVEWVKHVAGNMGRNKPSPLTAGYAVSKMYMDEIGSCTASTYRGLDVRLLEYWNLPRDLRNENVGMKLIVENQQPYAKDTLRVADIGGEAFVSIADAIDLAQSAGFSTSKSLRKLLEKANFALFQLSPFSTGSEESDEIRSAE